MIDNFKGDYFFLSNYYNSPILFGLANGESMMAPTMEHYFQASKTIYLDQQKKILSAATPGEAKKLGRTCTLRSDWEEIKDSIMYLGLRQKFHNPTLQKKLLATGEEELIEGNWWNDTYWGVCNGVGKNKLGKLLMKLREEYKNQAL